MSNGKILIVDDDPDIVFYLSSLLSDQGHRTMSAGSANAAWEALSGFEPDVLIIDVLMPGRSGLDFLVRLRSARRWSHVPVILITGYDKVLDDDCKSYLAQHPDVRAPEFMMPKPVDQDTLLSSIAKLLSQQPG